MTDTALIRLDGKWTTEGLTGTVYHFQKGDGLPVHVHPTPNHNHITVVISGSLLCQGHPAIEGQIIRAGDVLDWVVGEHHGFSALEDGTVFVNVTKGRVA